MTARDRKTLILMCNLACEWESTLADANDTGRPEFTWADSQRKAIRACLRNIKRFETLTKRLLHDA